MDNMDDPETTAKISDSAYSNSCSNSQSRRSQSSKSTRSGSHSSGSSGYGGKPSTSGSSNTLGQFPKKDKDSKKKKSPTEVKTAEIVPVDEPDRPQDSTPVIVAPQEGPISNSVVESTMATSLPEKTVESMDTSPPVIGEEEPVLSFSPAILPENYVTNRPTSTTYSDGFSVAISMRDGVVTYTTASLTATMGYPKDVWVGRSFIDFVHPKDYSTFSSLITNSMAFPRVENGVEKKGPTLTSGSTMVCRIRRYRSLNSAYGIKGSMLSFMPFLLKFSFKDFVEDGVNVTYLVVHASAFYAAFKVPNEIILKPNPFTIRHNAIGMLEYIDPESVPYLGYLPQDVHEKNMIQLYHPDDLPYLIQVYENIVRQGRVLRSRPYRVMAQNGDFVKLETEWSSVTNPWSMKLEFVIGIHYVIEGPKNPDVFCPPETNFKTTEPEKYKLNALRNCIIRIMNEVRTKPAENTKQVNGRWSHELATYMETLSEDQAKPDEELRLDIQDIQDQEHSYYVGERDSVLLGGISPHHDSDSKSSIETPLSYNQLNYNENLQRFFDSQPNLATESYYMIPGDVLGQNEYVFSQGNCLSPMAGSGDTNDVSSNASSGLPIFENSPGHTTSDYQYVRLTESVLLRHNNEMKKELIKMHRETRSSKEDREKASNETRKKKKEHLARCKAFFHSVTKASAQEQNRKDKSHGVKRPSKQESEATAHKHRCPLPHRHQPADVPAHVPPTQPQPANVGNHWQNSNVNTMNAYMYGVSVPQQMPVIAPTIPIIPGMPATAGIPATPMLQPMPGPSVMQPVPGTSGMYPVYYASAPSTAPVMTPNKDQQHATAGPAHPMPGVQVPMPFMMHGHPMCGQPFVYSPVDAHVYSVQPTVMGQQHSVPYSEPVKPLNLATGTYEQACKLRPPMSVIKPNVSARWREKRRAESSSPPLTNYKFYNGTFMNYSRRATDLVSTMRTSRSDHSKNYRNSDETGDRTDGESSYSSFYSSFFKTDSGSADDSGDQKKKYSDVKNKFWTKNNQIDDAMSLQSSNDNGTYIRPYPNKKLPRRKPDAPWNEQVNVTSELIYRYQVVTKSAQEVLEADKQKIAPMKQPPLVDEQLGQLYLDLHLQGVASRLTLEEGITSSSSSGEETYAGEKSVRKREYNKLTIIHEENAPLPPPDSGLPIPEGPPEQEKAQLGHATA